MSALVDVAAALALLALAVACATVLGRLLAPRRPATAAALVALPLVVGVARATLAERLREVPGGTLLLLAAGALGCALVALLAQAALRACAPTRSRGATLGGAAALVLGGAALVASDVPRAFADLVRDGLLAEASDDLLVSARAFDHEVWERGGALVEVERDAALAPDGSSDAEVLRFPDGLSTLVQTADVPARGARFRARVWVRRVDGTGPSDAGLALLVRAGRKGPYGQLVVHPTEAWTEYALEQAFGDDAGDEPVTFRLGNDHGDPRALAVAVWDASLVLVDSD